MRTWWRSIGTWLSRHTLLTLGGCNPATHRTYIYELDHPLAEVRSTAAGACPPAAAYNHPL